MNINMTELLEIREKIKLIYVRLEVFILPLVKFLIAFIVLLTVNSRLGYMARLDNMAIVLIVALACSFLPTGFILFFAGVFSLMHMYALGLEAALVGGCLYLVLYLMYFRLSPRDSLVVVLTPLLFCFHLPYVVPIAVGLLCGPGSAVSVACGIAVHYLNQTFIDSAAAMNTMGEAAAIEKIRLLIDGIIGNREMLVMIASFVITVLVVYLIRRLSVDYAWTIAMISGALINIVVLLIGDLIYNINVSLISALLGSLVALAVAKVIEFFRFCVDYNRTEKVQFEDDEYYYYVKAVPKMTVAMSTKTVKKINSQRARSGASRATAPVRGSAPARRDTGRRMSDGRYTSSGNGYALSGTTGRGSKARTKSITIGTSSQEDDVDDIDFMDTDDQN